MGWTREAQLVSLGFNSVELADPRMRISLTHVRDHFEKAAKTLERPDIGIQIGHKFRVATFVDTGSVLNFCDNLAHAANINRRYQPLVETAGLSAFVEENGRSYLQWTPQFDDDEHYRAMTEIIYGGYVATVQWLSWGFNKGVKSVELRHAKPSYSDVYDRLFQCPVSFGRPHNRLEFFPDTVLAPLPTSDADKMSIICQKLDKIMMRLEGETEISRRVRGAIRTLMGQKSVTLVNVASELGVSERTLRRSLRAEGVNFRDTVDDVRKGMFDTLSARGENLTSIAYMLGYNDQSAFTRAFRRWYGISPSAYRSQTIPI